MTILSWLTITRILLDVPVINFCITFLKQALAVEVWSQSIINILVSQRNRCLLIGRHVWITITMVYRIPIWLNVRVTVILKGLILSCSSIIVIIIFLCLCNLLGKFGSLLLKCWWIQQVSLTHKIANIFYKLRLELVKWHCLSLRTLQHMRLLHIIFLN